MSWLDNLNEFTTGFMEGIAWMCSDAEPAEHAALTGGQYDFRQHICELAEESGIQLTEIRKRRAFFNFRCRGESFFGTACLIGDRIHVAVLSSVRFPPGGVPSRLIQTVKEVNAELPRCDFELLEMKKFSAWCATASGDAMGITAPGLASVLTEMAICISKLDGWLSDNGFAE